MSALPAQAADPAWLDRAQVNHGETPPSTSRPTRRCRQIDYARCCGSSRSAGRPCAAATSAATTPTRTSLFAVGISPRATGVFTVPACASGATNRAVAAHGGGALGAAGERRRRRLRGNVVVPRGPTAAGGRRAGAAALACADVRPARTGPATGASLRQLRGLTINARSRDPLNVSSAASCWSRSVAATWCAGCALQRQTMGGFFDQVFDDAARR